MVFTTPAFVVFFSLFLWAWFILRGVQRKWLLLAGSYVFYGSWNPHFLALIILSTIIDYSVGRRLDETDDESLRRRLLYVSVCANLGILAVFKYANFFIDSATAGLEALGISFNTESLEILLPVGISFYTFQTMSYTVDVYRRTMPACRSPLDFGIYVAFFPQLVAGPIERAKRLLPQISELSERSSYDSSGWGLIALGCFKKVVIADNLARYVDAVYADPTGVYGPAMWVATYAFAIQIYCDFSGYSDIAVGLARILGIQLIQNFKAPYAAAGPSEFWRRWHISLSTWLRDYLYIGLGGNRQGAWHTKRNLMLTMLLGGLWHGAAWNFVLWGAWHGGLLIALRNVRQSAEYGLLSRIFRTILFFHFVCLGWALFRAQSLADCATLFTGMLQFWQWDWGVWLTEARASGAGADLIIIMGTCLAMLVVQFMYPKGSDQLIARLWTRAGAVKVTFVLTLLYVTMLAAPERAPPFIYFQF
ncbi:MAG: MBOAT family O-acyltransferase [Bradymonadia bacterium]